VEARAVEGRVSDAEEAARLEAAARRSERTADAIDPKEER
jgi:hypothetical protein